MEQISKSNCDSMYLIDYEEKQTYDAMNMRERLTSSVQ